MNKSTVRKLAKDRYPELFEISDIVINTLHLWIDRATIPVPTTTLGIVLHASNVRSWNLYKSINNLLKTDHWENAAILSRSMFELLLNLEEIQRDKKAEEEKAKKYLRFHKLQEYLHSKRLKEYDIKTGRCTKESSVKLARMEKLVKPFFDEFRLKNRASRWQTSWCGKSVYNLAKESPNPFRISQYEIIYSLFSDLSHSGPFATITTMLFGENQKKAEELISDYEDYEKEHTFFVLFVSILWIFEILFMGKDYIPSYDLKWNFEVTRRLYKYYGVEPRKAPWENTSQQ